MEKAVHGKKVKLMFRLLKERATKKAGLLSLEMKHTYNREAKTESQATKDGNVASGGGIEAKLEMEFLKTNTDIYSMLEYAFENQEEVEVWRIFFDQPQRDENDAIIQGKYFAQYGTGLISTFPDEADAESNTSVKADMTLNSLMVRGYATVDAEQDALAKAFFYDTVLNPERVDPIAAYTPSSTVQPTGIALSETEITLAVGETKTLTATVTPAEASDKSVTYTSENDAVATITPKLGKVTGVAAGTTVVVGETVNGLTSRCTVTVTGN